MKPIPFLSIGFRPFFASGFLFGAFAMLAWGTHWWYGLPHSFTPVGGIVFWHAHELIMGFGLAIIMGFLLTAVQNWTGLTTASPLGLLLLLSAWLLSRCVMAFGDELPSTIIVVIALLPIVGATMCIAKPIVKTRLWRNMFAPLVLATLAVIEFALIQQALAEPPQYPQRLLLVGVLVIVLMITMIGGRVIPFFSANKLGVDKPEESRFLLLLVVIPLLLLMLVQVIENDYWYYSLSSVCCSVLVLAHVVRLKQWHLKGLWNEPMLWSLWSSYACLPLGFALFALKPWYESLGSVPLHVITVGAMSGLIASMVSRVSMGHTGRVIKHDRWILLAFFGLTSALLVRTLGVMMFGPTPVIFGIGATLWGLCFVTLFLRFFLVWILPRPDGK